MREVKEETGLDVTSTRLLGLYEDFLGDNNEPVNYVVAAYKVEVIGGSIIFSKEAQAYKWLPLSEVEASREIPEVFKNVLSDLSKEAKKGLFFWKRNHGNE